MTKVIDPGHEYQLLVLDGNTDQTLTFVKRCDLQNPLRFPGNLNAHPGTTLQSVIRCLIERLDYLQKQIPDERNLVVRKRMEESLWLLEDRAADRHGWSFDYRVEDIYLMPMCPHCGHVVCVELGNAHH